MITALYHTIMAIPVMNEQSALEPVIYTAIGIAFPFALMFILKRSGQKKNMNAPGKL